MTEIQKSNETIAFYSQRSGEDVSRALAELLHTPEAPLSLEEREQVLGFESDLFEGVYRQNGFELHSGLDKDIESINKDTAYGSHVHAIATEFLTQPDATVFLQGVGIEVQEGDTADALLAKLEAVAFTADRALLRKLSTKSLTWARVTSTNALVNQEPVPQIHKERVFDSSEEILTKLAELGQYRAFLLDVCKDLKNQEYDKIAEPKRKIAELYLKVINGSLATIRPDALELWEQAKATNDTETLQGLELAWPNVESIADLSEENTRRYVVGLDRIRNGVGMDAGQFTSVTRNLKELSEQQASRGERLEDHEAIFTPEEVDRLAEIKLDAKGMQLYCEEILRSFGKLSEEPATTYERGRNRRASDGKWQVIISDGSQESLEVNDREGVLVVPNNFYRSLTRADPPIGVISGAGHEILHIFQNDNINTNTGSLKITKAIRGRSSLALREAGGIEIEQRVQKALFGQKRVYNGYYMRGMESIESGATKEDALQQLFEEYIRTSNDTPEMAAKSAYNNLQRLSRKGGYDSQPLNYLQAGLIIDQSQVLSEGDRAKLFAEGAYDLHDMVTLHSYGLDDSAPEAFPEEQYVALAAQYLRRQLNAR